MNKRTIASLSLSALMLGGTMVGFSHSGIANANSRSDAAAAKDAAGNAAKANKALAKGDVLTAIAFAESAVALLPQDAGYRSLLAGAYLKAGRFTSAHTAYADVLRLTPEDGRAALNLALSMIAEGQWDEARSLLDANASIVPASDRGLAIALAGDPAAGVALLDAAARSPTADAKTRQNLALALALAGRWPESRDVVGADLAPADADARIMQWAAFAKPAGAADQVSALLGVTSVKDPGQPASLALNTPASVSPASINPAPVAAMAAAEPVEGVAPTDAPVALAAVSAPANTGPAAITFGERREIVQAVPVAPVRTIAAPSTFKTRLARAPEAPPSAAPAKGTWFVQLGAFDNAGVAKDAWSRAQRRYPAFAEQVPTGMEFKSFYRLSVGGFSRGDANTMCRSYRAKGGSCFVRTAAGDQTAQWVKSTKVQLASR